MMLDGISYDYNFSKCSVENLENGYMSITINNLNIVVKHILHDNNSLVTIFFDNYNNDDLCYIGLHIFDIIENSLKEDNYIQNTHTAFVFYDMCNVDRYEYAYMCNFLSQSNTYNIIGKQINYVICKDISDNTLEYINNNF